MKDAFISKMENMEVTHRLPSKIQIQGNDFLLECMYYATFSPSLIPHVCVVGALTTEIKEIVDAYSNTVLFNSPLFPAYVTQGIHMVKKDLYLHQNKQEVYKIFQEIEDTNLAGFRGLVFLNIQEAPYQSVNKEFFSWIKTYIDKKHDEIRCVITVSKKMYPALIETMCVPFYTIFCEESTDELLGVAQIQDELENKYRLEVTDAVRECIGELVEGYNYKCEDEHALSKIAQVIAMVAYRYKDEKKLCAFLKEMASKHKKKDTKTIGFGEV